jgi:DNA-binding YbaB/EbfC family protein
MEPGGFDFGALMQSAAAMQQQMARAQASLADERATGSAGGGLVTAEVDGNGQLVSLTLDPSVVDPEDVETLADLIVAAVRDGSRAAEALAQQKMGDVAGGLLGGLPPGLDIPGLPGTVEG